MKTKKARQSCALSGWLGPNRLSGTESAAIFQSFYPFDASVCGPSAHSRDSFAPIIHKTEQVWNRKTWRKRARWGSLQEGTECVRRLRGGGVAHPGNNSDELRRSTHGWKHRFAPCDRTLAALWPERMTSGRTFINYSTWSVYNTPSEACCLKNISYLCVSRRRRTYLMKVFGFYPYAEIW